MTDEELFSVKPIKSKTMVFVNYRTLIPDNTKTNNMDESKEYQEFKKEFSKNIAKRFFHALGGHGFDLCQACIDEIQVQLNKMKDDYEESEKTL